MIDPLADCPRIITLELPDPLRRFVAERVRESGYADAGGYIYHLLRDEQKRLVRDGVTRLLHEGAAARMQERTENDWAGLRVSVAASSPSE